MEDWITSIESILRSEMPQPPQPSAFARSHRVPMMLRQTIDYDKYYVPKVVSIGPYHHGNPKLDTFQKRKLRFMKELLSIYNLSLEPLYKKFGDMVQECRVFYEESQTNKFSDEELTRMMLLDGFFILYFILFFFYEEFESSRDLRNHEIALVHQDLFLLENQIPFMVVTEMMKLIGFDHERHNIESFATQNILAPGMGMRRKKRRGGWFDFDSETNEKNELLLLDLLYGSLTQESDANNKIKKGPSINNGFNDADETSNNMRTFHNVNKLMDIGIRFKPSSSMSLRHVEFVRRFWWFSADIKLPPINMNKLLNLLAYELGSSHDDDEWVASYICLLDSLIDRPEDVNALRNAGVLDDSLANESDEEVVKLLKTIGSGLVPNYLAYSKVKKQIESHCVRWRNTRLADLKHEYFKSPWSLLALVGGLLVIFLSAVQTYFTVWSPKSECDDLCKFLKMHHHL